MDQDSKPRLSDWFVLFTLLLISLYSYVDRFVISVLIEPIKADLGLTDAQLGLLTGAAFSFFLVTMSLPMGWLADNWSRKRTIIAGMSVWSAATAGCGLSSSIYIFGLSRVAVGAGEAALSPAAYPMIYERFAKGSLGLAMGIFSFGAFLGSGVALIVVGLTYGWFAAHAGEPIPLIGDLAPWQQTFVALALPGIPLALALAFVTERRRPEVKQKPSVADVPPGTRPNIFSALAGRAHFFLPLFFGAAGMALITYALLSWLPAILVREFEWSPSKIGSIYGTIVALASLAGVLFGGLSVDKMTKLSVTEAYTKLCFAASLTCLLCIAFFAFADTAELLLVLAGILHFLTGFSAVLPAYVQMNSQDHLRGQITSVYAMTINLFGLGIGMPLIGAASTYLFADAGGLRTSVVLVTSISVSLSAVLFLYLIRSQPRSAA